MRRPVARSATLPRRRRVLGPPTPGDAITVRRFAKWAAATAADRGADTLVVSSVDGRHRRHFDRRRYDSLAVAAPAVAPEAPRARSRRLPAPLPVDDERFGIVLCTDVIEHIDEPRALLDDLNRALAADGMLFATTPLALRVGAESVARTRRVGLNQLLESSGFALRELAALDRSDRYGIMAQKSRPTRGRRL